MDINNVNCNIYLLITNKKKKINGLMKMIKYQFMAYEFFLGGFLTQFKKCN
jgi:hypothetical protein